MWLAMKLGVSFATTTPLPSRTSANREIRATIAGSVSGVGMISTSRRYRGGLKKCVPSQWRRNSSRRPSAIAAKGKPEGCDVTMVPRRRSARPWCPPRALRPIESRVRRSSCPGAVDEKIDDEVRVGFERIPAAAENPVGRHLVERAEEHLGGDGWFEIGSESPGGLALGDCRADEAEIVAQQRRRKALHELGRLAGLHLKDDRPAAIAAQARQMQPGESAQPLSRLVQVGRRRPSFGERLTHGLLR